MKCRGFFRAPKVEKATSITLLSLDRVAHTSGFNDKHRMGKMPMPRGTGVPPVRIGFTT